MPELTDADAMAYYKGAQRRDPWEGENYSGTSVLAGVQELQARGLIKTYRWAFGIDDLILTLGYKGPAILGIPWRADMYETDADGWVRVSGQVVGGHAILARGIRIFWKDPHGPKTLENLDRDRSYIILHNSWGPTWGNNGDGKISLNGLDQLLREQGEAVVITER